MARTKARSGGIKPVITSIVTPLIERRQYWDRKSNDISLFIIVAGKHWHGRIMPKEKELQPGIPASFDLVFWNKYYGEIFYGLNGWKCTQAYSDQDLIEKIGEFLMAYYQ